MPMVKWMLMILRRKEIILGVYLCLFGAATAGLGMRSLELKTNTLTDDTCLQSSKFPRRSLDMRRSCFPSSDAVFVS